MEGVELPRVGATRDRTAWRARSCGRGWRGSRRRSAACSPESWGEPVLWLTVREITRGRGGGDGGVGRRWGSSTRSQAGRWLGFFAGLRHGDAGAQRRLRGAGRPVETFCASGPPVAGSARSRRADEPRRPGRRRRGLGGRQQEDGDTGLLPQVWQVPRLRGDVHREHHVHLAVALELVLTHSGFDEGPGGRSIAPTDRRPGRRQIVIATASDGVVRSATSGSRRRWRHSLAHPSPSVLATSTRSSSSCPQMVAAAKHVTRWVYRAVTLRRRGRGGWNSRGGLELRWSRCREAASFNAYFGGTHTGPETLNGPTTRSSTDRISRWASSARSARGSGGY